MLNDLKQCTGLDHKKPDLDPEYITGILEQNKHFFKWQDFQSVVNNNISQAMGLFAVCWLGDINWPSLITSCTPMPI